MVNNWEISLNLGEKIPGKELLALLTYIDLTGALNRAVEEAGMSYRYAWGLLNRAEQSLGKPLVVRQTGGSSGGGMRLTEEGKKLLGHMQALQREVEGQLKALLSGEDAKAKTDIMLASTMEPVVTGLLDVLEQAYLQETGVTVRHVAAGSGQAISMAKAGRVDLIITHAPALELQFIRDGWGIRRVSFMGSDFIIVGPRHDPAGIAAASAIKEVFTKIAAAQALFVSRGDRSGTHLAEVWFWEQAGVSPVGEAWYVKAINTLGNYGILRRAAELGGYTLVDRASYLAGMADEKLSILYEGDALMKNVFSAIPVSRQKAAVHQEQAERFVEWLCSPTAQKIIAEFGKTEFGFSLFSPAVH